MMHAALEDYRWLMTSAGSVALARAAELLSGTANLVQCVQSLRKDNSAERAHLALETINLRQRGRAKFSAAEQMLFTRTGLEQATDEHIAAYKASRFSSAVPVADGCTGIGGDLISLAQRDSWSGADREPVLRWIAAHNVAVMTNIAIDEALARMQAEVAIEEIPAAGYWHLDPDRRTDGKRSVRLEAFSPSLDFVEQLAAARPHGALKIAPASEVPETWRATVEREWISRGGECRQQVVWFGNLSRFAGEHSATMVGSDGQVCTFHGDPTTPLPVAERAAKFIHEPDASVLAANLTGAIAQALDLAALASGSVYLTSDQPSAHAALTSFEVRDLLPLDIKQLRAYFRARNVGRLEIKKRGVEIRPEELRKSLALQGDEGATLIVTRLGKKSVAFVAERVGNQA